MTNIKFFKMHALGNDFVIAPCPVSDMNLSTLSKFVADRKLGVGCDQVIFFEMREHDVFVRFFNCDGSEAEMCGNGIRALGLLLNMMYNTKNIHIKTMTNTAEVTVHPNSINTRIYVSDLNYGSNDEIYEYAKSLCPQCCKVGIISAGNPHITMFFQQESYIDDDIFYDVGTKIEAYVKGGINVGFASIHNNSLLLKVWERGAGFTQGCGSGASAAAALAYKLQLICIPEITVYQLGGELSILVESNSVLVKGNATYVFSGEMEYA